MYVCMYWYVINTTSHHHRPCGSIILYAAYKATVPVGRKIPTSQHARAEPKANHDVQDELGTIQAIRK